MKRLMNRRLMSKRLVCCSLGLGCRLHALKIRGSRVGSLSGYCSQNKMTETDCVLVIGSLHSLLVLFAGLPVFGYSHPYARQARSHQDWHRQPSSHFPTGRINRNWNLLVLRRHHGCLRMRDPALAGYRS